MQTLPLELLWSLYSWPGGGKEPIIYNKENTMMTLTLLYYGFCYQTLSLFCLKTINAYLLLELYRFRTKLNMQAGSALYLYGDDKVSSILQEVVSV